MALQWVETCKQINVISTVEAFFWSVAPYLEFFLVKSSPYSSWNYWIIHRCGIGFTYHFNSHCSGNIWLLLKGPCLFKFVPFPTLKHQQLVVQQLIVIITKYNHRKISKSIQLNLLPNITLQSVRNYSHNMEICLLCVLLLCS